MIRLLRYTGLRIIDVATLARDRVREDRIYLYTMKKRQTGFLAYSCVSPQSFGRSAYSERDGR